MTRDDEERLDSDEEKNADVSAEEIEDEDLQDVSGGLRMNPVSATLGEGGRLGRLTIQPAGRTITMPRPTTGKRR